MQKEVKMVKGIPRNPKMQLGEVVWDKDKVKNWLATDVQALYRAILMIFDQQTLNEQKHDVTEEDNGVGFTGFDAEILSSFAKQLRAGKGLSEKQVEIAKKRMPKYACQLLYLAQQRKAIIAERSAA